MAFKKSLAQTVPSRLFSVFELLHCYHDKILVQVVSSNQWSFQGWAPEVGQKAHKFDGASNGEEEEKNQAKEAKMQASSTVTEVGKGKKRKVDTETHHAPSKKQVATDGTKRVSECQRKKK